MLLGLRKLLVGKSSDGWRLIESAPEGEDLIVGCWVVPSPEDDFQFEPCWCEWFAVWDSGSNPWGYEGITGSPPTYWRRPAPPPGRKR